MLVFLDRHLLTPLPHMNWKQLALEQAALIEQLQQRNNELEAEIATLKKNSSNSSKPPSSDIVKPAKDKNRRQKNEKSVHKKDID